MCSNFKLEDILDGCFGLPNEIVRPFSTLEMSCAQDLVLQHPHTDPVLQLGTLNISSEGTQVFPVRCVVECWLISR